MHWPLHPDRHRLETSLDSVDLDSKHQLRERDFGSPQEANALSEPCGLRAVASRAGSAALD